MTVPPLSDSKWCENIRPVIPHGSCAISQPPGKQFNLQPDLAWSRKRRSTQRHKRSSSSSSLFFKRTKCSKALKHDRNTGCGLRHATSSLLDRLCFVGFYCLSAFCWWALPTALALAPAATAAAAPHHQFLLHLLLLFLTPTPSKQPFAASRVSVQRAAAEDTPGAAAARTRGSVIQRPPAGRCSELERLPSLSLFFFPSSAV